MDSEDPKTRGVSRLSRTRIGRVDDSHHVPRDSQKTLAARRNSTRNRTTGPLDRDPTSPPFSLLEDSIAPFRPLPLKMYQSRKPSCVSRTKLFCRHRLAWNAVKGVVKNNVDEIPWSNSVDRVFFRPMKTRQLVGSWFTTKRRNSIDWFVWCNRWQEKGGREKKMWGFLVRGWEVWCGGKFLCALWTGWIIY